MEEKYNKTLQSSLPAKLLKLITKIIISIFSVHFFERKPFQFEQFEEKKLIFLAPFIALCKARLGNGACSLNFLFISNLLISIHHASGGGSRHIADGVLGILHL